MISLPLSLDSDGDLASPVPSSQALSGPESRCCSYTGSQSLPRELLDSLEIVVAREILQEDVHCGDQCGRPRCRLR